MGWGRGAGDLGVSWLWWFCVGAPGTWDLQVGSSQAKFCPVLAGRSGGSTSLVCPQLPGRALCQRNCGD